MIPRGADFPPDSAPPAKRRESATMRRDRPALPAAPPRAVRLLRGRRSAQLRAAVLQRCAGRTQGKAPHTLRVMTPGVFGPATTRTATASISLLFSAASGSRPRAPIAWLRGPRPGKTTTFPPQSAAAASPIRQAPSVPPEDFSQFLHAKKEPARSQAGSLSGYSLLQLLSLS